jgi:hypothetical protein
MGAEHHDLQPSILHLHVHFCIVYPIILSHFFSQRRFAITGNLWPVKEFPEVKSRKLIGTDELQREKFTKSREKKSARRVPFCGYMQHSPGTGLDQVFPIPS